MKNLTHRDYLVQRQYRDASNLQTRIALHQRCSTNPQGLPRWFVDQLPVPDNGRVLEVCCGPGSYRSEVAGIKSEPYASRSRSSLPRVATSPSPRTRA